MIVLDNTEAAKLPSIPGRFVFVVGLQTLVVQVPRIFDDDIAGVVSSCRHAYPDVPEELTDTRDKPKVTTWDEQRVLVAAIDWLEGQVSAKKLHAMLGSESPGERHLSRVCRRLVDQITANGYGERGDDGSQWVIKRHGKTYTLTRRPGDVGDDSDAAAVMAAGSAMSPTAPPDEASHAVAAD
jgi:hypothetical protein